MRYSSLISMCAATLAALFSGAASAQGAAGAYPVKPITVIIPTAAGGPGDVETRIYTAKMTGLLGQSIVIDYKPGAGSTIGTGYVAKSAPDGYTLLAVQGAFTSFPALYKDLPFDSIKDFAPISLMTLRASVLLAYPSFPAKNFAEYIAYAKANPGKINYATTGAGGTGHLAGAWLHNETNTKVTFVHYKGVPPLMTDLQVGRVDVSPLGLAPSLPFIKSGKLRALALMNNERSKLLPGVATMGEKDIPGYDYRAMLGFSAPAATPAAIVNFLSEAFAKVAKMPDVIATLAAEGSTVVGSTPAQFRQILVTETAQWRKVIQDNGIKLEE